MKKFITLAVLLFACSWAMHAQSLLFMKNETRVKLVIDFSEAAINGYSEENILEFEEDWEVDQPALYGKLASSMNEAQEERQYGKFDKARYTLVFRPQLINGSGNVKGYFVITDADGRELAKVYGISARGGKYGTFLNLVGDGMKHVGPVIAKKVNKLAK